MNRFHSPVLLFLLIFIHNSAMSEGIWQLKPDSNYICNLNINSNTGGGGYSCFATDACPSYQRLYVRVGSISEKVYLGFNTGAKFKIMKGNATVFGPYTINTSSTKGYIHYYKQCMNGPKELDPVYGYSPLVFVPNEPGDYSIDFVNSAAIYIFDVTVIDTASLPLHAINGRLWSQDWGFNTSSISLPYGAFKATQYIYSDDSIVTSLYYNMMRGNVFDVTSTENGCYPPPVSFDSSCKSTTGNHHYAQYKIFLNDPDPVQFPSGHIGTITPGSVVVVPNCDGSFNVSFAVSKAGRASLEIEVNPLPGHQSEDVTVLDSVNIGTNTILWNGLDGLGNPVPVGQMVTLSITYWNGLSNIALYDVERHLDGFIVSIVRPPGPPIAMYWNDTLLANKGGRTNLLGCIPAMPATGCHSWEGDYYGVGIGSYNTVNTWWYVATTTQAGSYAVNGTASTAAGITQPPVSCIAGLTTFSVEPNPLPGAEQYEWLLTDAATGTVLLDLTNTGPTVNIDMSLYPPAAKRLKVRGINISCGDGPYGPAPDGILINPVPSPTVTNTITDFTICNGSQTDITLTSSQTGTSYTYSAKATSPFITGYSDGTVNPINQTLFNNSPDIDSVIYKVVPYAAPCYGDTTRFYVRVVPQVTVTNNVTAFTICSGDSAVIPLTSIPSGCTFSWIATGSSPDISGFSDGSGQRIANKLVNTGYTPQTVTYTVTSYYQTCISNPFILTVTVRPVPDVSNSSLSTEICDNSLFLLNITSHVAGALFTWTVTSPPQVTGWSANPTVPLNTISQLLNNSSLTVQTVTYHLFPVLNGCPGIPSDYQVTVRPPAFVSFIPCMDTITSINAKPFLLRGGVPPGGIYSGPGVNGTTSVFNPSLAGTGRKTITYTYSGSMACVNSKTIKIKVVASPIFSCGNNFTDVRDGTVYSTKQFGMQCWMTENLKSGSTIFRNNSQRDNCQNERYSENFAGTDIYLYQWDEVMQYQENPGEKGICPPGWHVPDTAEWNILFRNYFNIAYAASPLKVTGFSGFNAPFNGAGIGNVNYYYSGFASFFWTSNSQGPFKAWAYGFNDTDPSFSTYPSNRSNGFAVRCLKD